MENPQLVAAPPDTMARGPVNQEYREWLVKAQHRASQDFDKTVLAISSGALGLSVAFLNSQYVSGPFSNTVLIGIAWMGFGVALVSSLGSLFTSSKALRKCIEQVDAGVVDGETPGGVWTSRTDWLNLAAWWGVFLGVTFLVLFASFNTRRLSNANAPYPTSTPPSAPATAASPAAAPR